MQTFRRPVAVRLIRDGSNTVGFTQTYLQCSLLSRDCRPQTRSGRIGAVQLLLNIRKHVPHSRANESDPITQCCANRGGETKKNRTNNQTRGGARVAGAALPLTVLLLLLQQDDAQTASLGARTLPPLTLSVFCGSAGLGGTGSVCR